MIKADDYVRILYSLSLIFCEIACVFGKLPQLMAEQWHNVSHSTPLQQCGMWEKTGRIPVRRLEDKIRRKLTKYSQGQNKVGLGE